MTSASPYLELKSHLHVSDASTRCVPQTVIRRIERSLRVGIGWHDYAAYLPSALIRCASQVSGVVAVYWLVHEFLVHYFSVRPLLNGDLTHFKRSPLCMVGVDAVNNERLVA